MELRATLANQDFACANLLATKALYAQIFWIAIASVSSTTTSFFMCHGSNPLLNELYFFAFAADFGALAAGFLDGLFAVFSSGSATAASSDLDALGAAVEKSLRVLAVFGCPPRGAKWV